MLLERTMNPCANPEIESLGARIPQRWIDYERGQEAYATLLRQCDSSRALQLGKQLHGQISRDGYENDVYLANFLIQMYGRCGSVDEAHSLFNRLPYRNIYTYNILMAAFLRSGLLQDAKSLFDDMPERDTVSWNKLLAAYAQAGELGRAREVLDMMPRKNVVAWNSMVTAYAQRNLLDQARNVFDSMLEKNVVSWNCMVTGYAQNGYLVEAEVLFVRMPEHNHVSWNMMLAAYSRASQLESARSLFDRIPERDLVSWNTLVGAYASNGHLQEARRMFDRMEERNVATWNAIFKAYVDNSQCWEALVLYHKMDIKPDEITFTTLLDACTSLTDLRQGMFIHSSAVQSGCMSDPIVTNAVINMYSSCGKLDAAMKLFSEMPERTVVSWTEVISAYLKNSRRGDAELLFRTMIQAGMTPTEKTFVSLLSACSHSGLLEDAWHYFLVQVDDYRMVPLVKHCMVIVDLLSRAGQLGKAEALIKQMPSSQQEGWKTLLAACNVHGDSSLARRASRHLLDVEETSAGGSSYVLLSQVFCKSLAGS